jgi:hypothetical protein
MSHVMEIDPNPMNTTSPTTIPIRGTLTPEQYAIGYRALLRPTFALLLPIFALIGVGFIIVPLVLLFLRDTPPSFGTTLLPIMVVVGITGVLWYSYQFGGRQAYKSLPPSVRLPVTGHISETGVLWNTDVATTTFQWSAFSHYVMANDTLLLYQGTAATILPRAFFADENGWNAALRLVQSRLSTTPSYKNGG